MKPFWDKDGMTYFDDEQGILGSVCEDSPLLLFKHDGETWKRKHLKDLIEEADIDNPTNERKSPKA